MIKYCAILFLTSLFFLINVPIKHLGLIPNMEQENLKLEVNGNVSQGEASLVVPRIDYSLDFDWEWIWYELIFGSLVYNVDINYNGQKIGKFKFFKNIIRGNFIKELDLNLTNTNLDNGSPFSFKSFGITSKYISLDNCSENTSLSIEGKNLFYNDLIKLELGELNGRLICKNSKPELSLQQVTTELKSKWKLFPSYDFNDITVSGEINNNDGLINKDLLLFIFKSVKENTKGNFEVNETFNIRKFL